MSERRHLRVDGVTGRLHRLAVRPRLHVETGADFCDASTGVSVLHNRTIKALLLTEPQQFRSTSNNVDINAAGSVKSIEFGTLCGCLLHWSTAGKAGRSQRKRFFVFSC